MVKEAADIEPIDDNDELDTQEKTGKKSKKWAYILGVFGIIATILMAVAVVIWNEEIRNLQQFGYVGAFIISVLGGATIIIPVPALAVVFTLGGVMDHVWLVGISAALGELVGAFTIYMTGHGAGRAIANSRHGRVQRAYEKLLGMMERKGPIILFIVASVINPFFYPAALAAGALRLGIWKYTIIVLAGKIIKCMTVVYAGYYGLKGIFRAIGVDV
jgi:membrane protein YqaA with SNARE-associated domain